MSSPEDIASLSQEDLLVLVAELQRQVLALQEQVAQLAAENQELRAEVDRLTRQSKRQAAPFSKGTRSQNPKPPGRKSGEGTFSFRQAPGPEDITDPPVDVPVTRESCPSCGGQLTELRVDFVYVTELPPLPTPRVSQYRVWVCRCIGCGRKVRGEHPDLVPDQYGATAHRLGPRAMAVAHALHYQIGVHESPQIWGMAPARRPEGLRKPMLGKRCRSLAVPLTHLVSLEPVAGGGVVLANPNQRDYADVCGEIVVLI
jgi:transposase